MQRDARAVELGLEIDPRAAVASFLTDDRSFDRGGIDRHPVFHGDLAEFAEGRHCRVDVVGAEAQHVGVACQPMRQVGSCRDAFKVRAHDVGHAVNGGVAPQRIHRQFALSPPITQRFQRHVPTDFVAVLEAVGRGLGGVETLFTFGDDDGGVRMTSKTATLGSMASL